MNHASPCGPYITRRVSGLPRRLVFQLVKAMKASVGKALYKKSACLAGELVGGVGMKAIYRDYVCARARVFVCAHVILRICLNAYTQLTSVQYTNELTRFKCVGLCRHLPSLPSQSTWRASR